jgi:hypothetical protein
MAGKTVQLVHCKFWKLEGHGQQRPESVGMTVGGLHSYVVGQLCQLDGCCPILHQCAVEWHREHLHVDIPLGHLLKAAFYIDHAGIAVHPADQALSVLADGRAVVPENALKALDVSG